MRESRTSEDIQSLETCPFDMGDAGGFAVFKGIKVRRNLAKFVSVALALVMISGLAGCGASELGGETNSPSRAPVRYSVKSNHTKFNIDDVTLDFYFGNTYHGDPTIAFQHDPDKHELVSFVLYFCDGQYYQANYNQYSHANTPRIYSDYHIVEGHYLVKE